MSGNATLGTDTGNVPTRTVPLQYSKNNGTTWNDYTADSYVQMTGTSMLVRTGITQDTSYEGAETFKLVATNAGGTTNDIVTDPTKQGIGTIKDELHLNNASYGEINAWFLASYGVMVSVMNLTGYVVVHHGHSKGDLFPIISAHIVGMYGLVLVVGDIIDRVGKRMAMVGGLLITAVSSLGLIWVHSIAGTAFPLFLLGIGWVFSFVAATTQLADLTAPSERGKLIGFSDLLSGVTGASLAIGGGLAVTHGGTAALSLLAAAFALAPVPLIALRRRRVALLPTG